MILKSLHWFCRLVLAGVFIYSGYIKVQNPLQFAVAISAYKLVPENLVFPMAQYLPWIEIVLGLAILIGWKIRYFSSAAALLLLSFMTFAQFAGWTSVTSRGLNYGISVLLVTLAIVHFAALEIIGDVEERSLFIASSIPYAVLLVVLAGLYLWIAWLRSRIYSETRATQ